eukprot:6348926-Amphidinium_carterae.2
MNPVFGRETCGVGALLSPQVQAGMRIIKLRESEDGDVEELEVNCKVPGMPYDALLTSSMICGKVF